MNWFSSILVGDDINSYRLICIIAAAEEYFTSRSKIDVRELKENYPEFALVLEVRNGKSPNFSDLSYTEVPVNNLEVGSYILVKAGEVCTCNFFLIFHKKFYGYQLSCHCNVPFD